MIVRPSHGARLLLIALAFVPGAAQQALAQDVYPSRPIRLVVPIPTGSGTDTVARAVAHGLTERFGRQVFVDNRPGAGTTIGNEIVARAKPDGYTLLMNGAALTISPAIYRKIPYDTLRELTPITVAVFTPNLMVVHPSVPAKSVKEFIALARAQPGKILYASGGNGTNSHLAAALFASMAQVQVMHVPYKGSIPGIIDLVSGNVAMAINSMSTVMPQVRAGKLRALGVASARRVGAAPDLPTIAEAGVPGYESVQWSGLLAPAGTPPEIVSRLHRETVAIVRTPDMKERLAADGSEVIANSPDEFAAFLRSELVKWAKVVKTTGIEPM